MCLSLLEKKQRAATAAKISFPVPNDDWKKKQQITFLVQKNCIVWSSGLKKNGRAKVSPKKKEAPQTREEKKFWAQAFPREI